MPRVKRGMMTRKRHNNVIKQAKGYWGLKKNVFQVAKEAVRKSGNYAYRDRRNKKRSFRRLWITRISAACRMEGTTYSALIHALIQAGIEHDRKALANMVVNDMPSFVALTKQVGLVAA